MRLFAHETHAEIGSYGRHLVPWWESKVVGWKLWFPDSVDMYAKRRPQLVANHEIQGNISGHAAPKEYGNDILWVADTFGVAFWGLLIIILLLFLVFIRFQLSTIGTILYACSL